MKPKARPFRPVAPCWECSKRRLVCDLGTPKCRKCRVRGVDCPGYQHKPLQWMRPGQTRSKGAQSAKTLGVSCPPARSDEIITNCTFLGQKTSTRAKASEDSKVEDVSSTPACEAQTAMTVLRNMSGRSTFEILIQAVVYYNINIAPDLSGISLEGAASPFIVPSSYVSWIPPAISQTLICSALGHRILQTAEGFERERNAMALNLRQCRGEALQLVRRELTGGRDSIMPILCLLLSEIQHSISPSWWHHVDAAYTLIDMHGGFRCCSLLHPNIRPMYQFLVYVDVLGAATSPCVNSARAQRQLELLPYLQDLFGDRTLTCIPCAPGLLAEVIRINYYRFLMDSPTSLLSDSADQLPSGSDILRRVLNFSPELWASEVVANSDFSTGGSLDETGQGFAVRRMGWERIGRIYQSAVVLYCLASQPQGFDHVRESDQWTSLRAGLLQDLRDSSLDACSHHRKLVIWPLTILGLALNYDDGGAQQFVLQELKWASAALGTATPLVAIQLLESTWQGYSGWEWDKLFDRPYIFAL
ncbi:hypothetical protein FOMA001_g18272 [Fusarium oxysporum f. sp. matthiolae]|nr:hypothetical protein FOMA001_g18272 [Fusarium oxysporum f. sp. matthiolae]